MHILPLLIIQALLLSIVVYIVKYKPQYSDKYYKIAILSLMVVAINGVNTSLLDYSPYSKQSGSDHPPAETDPKESHYESPKEDKVAFSYELFTPDKVKTKFSDVYGMNEVKTEVSEVIDFLHNPKKFERLGAQIPKGILLYGPPGTGKTLLARSLAGESKASFIAVSGSAFDDQYVGVGARRMRALFEIARNHKPCIIFIDEIDAVAPKRTQEKEVSGQVQTINQLLSEMDNINDQINKGIIIVGATNRLDFLDEAILRPGRFDRKIYIRLPNLQERKAIFQAYLNKTVYAKNINIPALAGRTMGFSGADIKNLVNEAAILAARSNAKEITQQDFETAKDKLILGLPVASAQVSEMERKVTAYHEAGHAIIGILQKDQPLKFNKITIGVRDETLGVTHFEKNAENYLESRKALEGTLAMLLGGRAAEELIFGQMNITGGAQQDLQKASKLAQSMVLSLGLSDLSSVVAFDALQFYPSEKTYAEIEKVLEKAHANARAILTSHMNQLHRLAEALLEKETLDYNEVMRIVKPTP